MKENIHASSSSGISQEILIFLSERVIVLKDKDKDSGRKVGLAFNTYNRVAHLKRIVTRNLNLTCQ